MIPLTPTFVEQISVNAILLGLVYGMVGLGLSLVLGIMNVLNISHGSMYILGGYLTYYISEQLHYAPILGLAFAAVVTFGLGVVFELIFVDRVSNDPTRVMLITFGITIIIEQVTLLIWGGTAIPTPALVKGFTTVGRVIDFQNEQLLAALTGIGVAVITSLFLRFTEFGRAMRMVSQNSEAALSIGVNSRWVFAVALGIGSLYAGLAGSLLSPITFCSAELPVVTTALCIRCSSSWWPRKRNRQYHWGAYFRNPRDYWRSSLPIERGYPSLCFDNRDYSCTPTGTVWSKGKNLIRFSRTILFVGIIFYVALGVVPLITRNQFFLSSMIFVFVFALFAAAWDLSYGVAGIINLGPARHTG